MIVLALCAAPPGLLATFREPAGTLDITRPVVAFALVGEPHPLQPQQMTQHFGVVVILEGNLRNVVGAKLSQASDADSPLAS